MAIESPETTDAVEAFLREVDGMSRDPMTAAWDDPAVVVSPSLRSASPPRDAPVLVHSARSGGVWRVTRDGAFVGDYLSEGPARQAAADVAREARRRGLRAEVLFGPDA